MQITRQADYAVRAIMYLAKLGPDEKAATKLKIKRFNELFREKHGTLTCKVLTGFDISTPEGADAAYEAGVFLNKCPKFIETACNILEEDF